MGWCRSKEILFFSPLLQCAFLLVIKNTFLATIAESDNEVKIEIVKNCDETGIFIQVASENFGCIKYKNSYRKMVCSIHDCLGRPRDLITKYSLTGTLGLRPCSYGFQRATYLGYYILESIVYWISNNVYLVFYSKFVSSL